MNKYIRCFYALFFVLSASVAKAQSTPVNADSIRFSLLTCTPGEEIYSLFGHTAIRYENESKGIDYVFNYGLFSFDTPHFVWRFVKGETYYMLGVTDYQRFAAEYMFYNRAVWQQTLNLTAEEKEKLLALLEQNYLPKNRIYRYNFFYDNCATRPRDKIEESINGKIVYKGKDNRYSFRDIVLQASEGHEWDRFGMNFCLGAKADRPIHYREEMYAPFHLMDAFAHAIILDKDHRERPLVSDTKELISKEPEEKAGESFSLTPFRSALLLFIGIAVATIYGIRKKKSLWGIDLFLFAVAGLCGCVIAFLCLFSTHPAVDHNYLIFVFNPLHIILLPFFLYKERKHRKSYYHQVNATLLILFILLWPVIPQHFDIAVLPLALSLLVRSMSHILLTYNKKK